MFTRTWDYNGVAVGLILALLEQIFDRKIMIFSGNFFLMYDKSNGSADNNETRLVKVVYNLFNPNS